MKPCGDAVNGRITLLGNNDVTWSQAYIADQMDYFYKNADGDDLLPRRALGYARFDTRGELRLAERLKDFLEENAVVWHNLPVGPRNRHPDFIIVHPANGLLVLEVKDWRLESIASADKGDVQLLTARGCDVQTPPMNS